MKTSLPPNHGLPPALLERPEFLFRQNGEPSLTDVQWEALSSGVGRGESVLALAPTSTGKTQIGVWAFASWLFTSATPRRAVYLVTHRSLANQKFEEFRRILHDPLDAGFSSRIVLATGDRQVSASGIQVTEPLRATLLVATYEKYLGLLCGSGIPSDLHDTCVVADEIQILGDRVRGVNVEVLLTLLRQAAPGQLIGLSAVLNPHDGQALADWLRLRLVRVPYREKHLYYECRTPSTRLSFRTESPGDFPEEPLPHGTATELQPLIQEFMKASDGKPIVVFCMRKQDVYAGCRAYCESRGIPLEGVPPARGLSVDTPEAALLSATLSHRIAIHCADLVEDDRLIVEDAIANQEIDLIFATSTLAAGVNFPLGTAIFYSWKRWNSERQLREPISAGEFHNMAGRCGRMGTNHESGHVVFLANDGPYDRAEVHSYWNPDHMDDLESQISPRHFTRLILQLAATNMVNGEGDARAFLKATFGASQELKKNVSGLVHWGPPFQEALADLRTWTFLR